MTKALPRKSLIIASLLLVVVFGVLFAIRTHYNTDTQQPTPVVLTPSQKKAMADQELNSKRALAENDSSSTATNPSTPSDSSNSIILSAKQESDSSVTVFTKLLNITDGQCHLAITNGAATYSDSADVIYQPEYSICAGFSVLRNKLGSGTWNITLSVTSGTATKVKTMSFEVN